MTYKITKRTFGRDFGRAMIALKSERYWWVFRPSRGTGAMVSARSNGFCEVTLRVSVRGSNPAF